MKLVSILCMVFFATMGSITAPLCADKWEGPCEEEYSKWVGALAELQADMDLLRHAKQESVRSDILDAVSRADRRVSTARIVQSLLDKRHRLVAQEAYKCREIADSERFAFDDLKRCVGTASRRRGNAPPVLGPLARDRDKVMAELRDLLLDEAYVQYRGERDPLPASASSDSWPQTRASYQGQSQGNQRMNYGAPNYFAPGPYYGN